MLNVRLGGDSVENTLEVRNLLLKAVGTRIRKKANKKEAKKTPRCVSYGNVLTVNRTVRFPG